jgi:hypothetical protein
MSLTIRVTERIGDTERTIVIGEAPKPLVFEIKRVEPVELGEFVSGSNTPRDEAAARFVKLDARFQPVAESTTDATWAFTHDRTTDLVWARAESPEELTFAKAEKFCAGLGEGFRMPTIQERLILLDYDRHEPAINTAFFDSPKSGWSWTSTDAAWSKDAKTGKASAAWFVNLYNGFAYNLHRYGTAFVRAVRSGVPSGQ